MKQLVKTAIIGYCGYKVIDILMSKNESAEVKEEEYVPFDELEVKEESKKDTVKNVAMFVGGLTLGMAIKPTKKIIQEHYHISIFK
jgi:hypothetical protein